MHQDAHLRIDDEKVIHAIVGAHVGKRCTCRCLGLFDRQLAGFDLVGIVLHHGETHLDLGLDAELARLHQIQILQARRSHREQDHTHGQ